MKISMANKTILGLDLGTNSIGWALIEQNFEDKQGKIFGLGSRIIPMSQDVIDNFGDGKPTKTQTSERTNFRSSRRLRERYLLRRERLHRVLNILGFLPKHFSDQIDFEKKLGQFKSELEPKLVYNNKKFIFQDSFNEMLEDFKTHQPSLIANDKKVPYDWTIYYLRKKALTQKIQKEELAWILLNFNQKRGYYQLRGEEEEENPNKRIEFYSLKVIEVKADEQQKDKDDIWYSMVLENGWIYSRSSKTPLFDWKDKTRDFIVTTDLNDDGEIKRRSFRAPSSDDWTLLKKKTEQDIDQSNKTVGIYIYDSLLQNPHQKIKGKLVRTIERKYYKEELVAILEKQIQVHPELKDDSLFADCIRELYRNNERHQSTLKGQSFLQLFVNDIIFYQRPLRSQKSSIGNCSLEKRKFRDTEGVEQTVALKAIPKSNPVFQEFRVWKWMSDLAIYRKDDDTNVTNQFLPSAENYEELFKELFDRKEIKQETLLKYLIQQAGLKGKSASIEAAKYRWNFVEDKIYPLNETRAILANRLTKVAGLPENFLTKETERHLWHIIYSVTDKIEYEKALLSFARKQQIDEATFLASFKKIPPFKPEYASYSEKAVNKLLPLMRLGKYWNWESIDANSRDRIEKIINGEFDENISARVREKAKLLTEHNHFQALPDWLAKYIVYGRHSEIGDISKWNSVGDLSKYLEGFRQHGLRNPIVEQVVTETLRVIKDIWQRYGNGAKDFFDEIHVELSREMKNTAKDRAKLTDQISENENTNLRLKALLVEMMQQGDVDNVRPYSPAQLEILKIYEDGVLNSDIEVPDDILKISKTAQPTSKELLKYKLWLEQKYRSPYTGEMIPLTRLFTPSYEIEHIIPQSRYFDDSFGNKVICEAAVNKLKDNQLGFEFIKNHHGEKVETGFGSTVKILEESAYQDFVKVHYAKSRGKRAKLLIEEIPEKMIERQLNDTRYISKFISSVLSNIVRADTNDDGLNSKNILPGNGKITSQLRQDWGLNDVWNDLIFPRFERMNELRKTDAFTAYSKVHQKQLPSVPLEFSKGFQKKRIDHRHHALDALVIASTTRNHINLLNNQHANSDIKRYDLQRKLRKFEKAKYFSGKENRNIERDVPKEFLKPWNSFTSDAKMKLETVIVSFKQNLRVINKATNKYESYKDENGNLRIGKDGKPQKGLIPQTKGDSWAIRKSMHKDTVSGKIDLPMIKTKKGRILTATRKSIDTSFDDKIIESITDTGIQKILKNYLSTKEGNTELAFSPEGLEDMNKNIEKYNEGMPHKPIFKVRIFELGSKFPLGQTGNKKDKYAEADKGTNLFFAVYWDEEKKKRNYETVPLNEVIEHQKWRATLTREQQKQTPMIPLNLENGVFLFSLSPNDLVYVPEIHEDTRKSNFKPSGIYKVVSFSGNQCFFVKEEVATSIVNKAEYSTLNKMERSIDGKMIKESCIKIQVDRLGEITSKVF
jgi:CRISPR-associated endonuclease Csn1